VRRLRPPPPRPRGRRGTVVELDAVGDSGRDLELGDLVLPDAVEHHAKGADGVAVRYHDHRPATYRLLAQVVDDDVAEVGSDARHDVLQALGRRDELRGHVAVARVLAAGARVAVGQRRRRHVVRAAPELDLFHAELVGGLLLVLAGEVPVVALVEPPAALDRQPRATRDVQGDLGGADGPREHRRVQHAQVETVLAGEQLTGAAGLVLSLAGQVHVLPAREQVELVPFGLAMAKKYQIGHPNSVPSAPGTVQRHPSRQA
jgi:hypothetical protein